MVMVLDEIGCERVTVLGFNVPVGLFFAATHPERTTALILVNTTARVRRDDDYPEGIPDEEIMGRRALREGSVHGMQGRSLCSEPGRRLQGSSGGCNAPSGSVVHPNDRLWRMRTVTISTCVTCSPAVRAPAIVVSRGGRIAARPDTSPITSRRELRRSTGRRRTCVRGRHRSHPRRDRRVPYRRAGTAVGRPSARHGVVHRHRRLDTPGRRAWGIDAGESCSSPTTRSSGRTRPVPGPCCEIHRRRCARPLRRPRPRDPCAIAIRDALLALGLEVRAGLHTGEIELAGDDVAGITVHTARRSRHSPEPAKSSCRVPSRIFSPDPIASTTRANTNSKACQEHGGSSACPNERLSRPSSRLG